MQIKDFLGRLNGVKQTGDGYVAYCPVHEADGKHNPSLSISAGDDEKILVNCHAGCKTDDICKAVGLTTKDLFQDTKAQRRIVAEYNYTDESGKLIFQKVRYEPKDFRCRVPDGSGWSYKLNGCRKVLYNLPGITKDNVVFIVEGEKDADCLIGKGYAATCNFDGAGKWLDGYNQYFAGKMVYICGDNDTPGRNHVRLVFDNIKPVAGMVRFVQIPAPHKDISDYFAAGGDVQGFNKLTMDAVDDIPDGWGAETVKDDTQTDHAGIMSVCVDDVQTEEVDWLWNNVIPAGELTLLVGNGSAGKTTMSSYIMARVSTGTFFYGSLNTVGVKNVIFLGNEDSIAKQLKPRLVANGADCKRIHAVDYVKLAGDGLQHTFNIKDHLHHLIDLIDKIGDVGLIVIDPITQFLGDVSENNNSEVRTVLAPLIGLIRERGITCIGISHLNKKSDIQSAYRILGSIAFVAAARSVWLVAAEKDKDDPTADPTRYFMPVKCNYSINPMALTFRIQGRGEIVFDGECDCHPDDVLSGGHTPKAKNDAKDWLKSFIGTDAIPAADVVAAGEEKGFSYATIQRAANDLGISKRRSVMHNNKYVWSLER